MAAEDYVDDPWPSRGWAENMPLPIDWRPRLKLSAGGTWCFVPPSIGQLNASDRKVRHRYRNAVRWCRYMNLKRKDPRGNHA